MRIKHNLWRLSNGWLLVPEEDNGVLRCEDAQECAVFRTLKEFADQYPKRERRKKNKPITTEEKVSES
jgi:hypothetical protein